MHIREIHIKNFGKLQNRNIIFSPGLNVVYGENEAGKSTLQNFILGMLFGMEKPRGRSRGDAPYEKYEPWDAPACYAGSMRFTTGGQDFYLERNFYHKEKTSYLVNERDQEELSVEQGDLQMLLGDISKEAYENTFFVGQDGAKPKAVLENCLRNGLHNLSETGDGSFQLSQTLQYLQKERRKLETACRAMEVEQKHRMELLATEERVLELNIEKLQDKYAQKKREAVNEEQQAGEQELGEPDDQAVQKKCFHPAAALGVVLSLIWFLLWQQGQMGRVPWIAGQIIFLAVIIAGLRAVWKEDRTTQKETAAQKPDTQVEREKQRAVLATISEELQEIEIELENKRSAQREAAELSAADKNLQTDIRAISLAEDTLKKLAEEQREQSAGKLDEAVSEIFRQITGGRYETVHLSEKYEPQMILKHKVRRPEQFSGGTMQQLYFSMRMAAGQFLTQDEKLPFLLDEVFSMYDEKRLMETLRWLGSQKCQILLFTCQEREEKCLRELGIPYNSIHMSAERTAFRDYKT